MFLVKKYGLLQCNYFFRENKFQVISFQIMGWCSDKVFIFFILRINTNQIMIIELLKHNIQPRRPF
jgi:hypothetical protein